MGALTVPSNVGQRIVKTALNTNGDITVSDTWIVPPDVNVINFNGCSGGGGGGGGNNTPGGGGGGGGGAQCHNNCVRKVIPGETLTFVLGAAGLGGAVNTNGTSAGFTTITGSVSGLIFISNAGGRGFAGAAVNGGSGGDGINIIAGGVGGAAAGGIGTPVLAQSQFGGMRVSVGASAGGALNFAGGASSIGLGTTLNAISGQAGNATGGGGGNGGGATFNAGTGGVGGANGGAPVAPAATSYGVGGGGGSGNNAGTDGVQGVLQIWY